MTMQLDLTGKAVVVIGSSRGIGRAIAKAFLDEGCRVALNGRDETALGKSAGALGATAVAPGDASTPDGAAAIVARANAELGGIDVLVCNAGGGRSVAPGSESAAEWRRVFDQNLWSATNVIEAARPALSRAGGAVVCVSSICGSEVVAGAPVTYSAAKAALNAYVRGIARPLGRDGVRINAVAPGNIVFDGSTWARRRAEDPAAVQRMLEHDVALNRLGTPEDVANLVLFLASPRAAFATGAVWILDGGQTHG
jgi:NAD(P)-dependent dehydrogenase (short-subunit alcohol dehydrogenase family)